MSSDFSGKNKNIKKGDYYLTLSNCMSNLLSSVGLIASPSALYNFYAENDEFKELSAYNNETNWGYFDRYNNKYDSNSYTQNKLDDLIVFKHAVEKKEYLNKDFDTAEERRNSLMSACSSLIENGVCNRFQLSTYFPHLDCPKSITSIDNISGTIPCILPDNEYATLYGNISYASSCSISSAEEPVPYYGLDKLEDKLFSIKSTEIKDYDEVSASFLWEITANADQITIDSSTSSMIEDHLNIATLSSAIIPRISASLTYTEIN